MNSTEARNFTEARRQAEQLISHRSAARTTVNEKEARSREVQRKIEYLRQLHLAANAQRTQDLSNSGHRTGDRFLTAFVPDTD
jgi:hypothetical protein